MNALDSLLGSPFAYHLGWTLLHFLWQGALVGLCYACVRGLLAEAAPQLRYLLSLTTLLLLALLPMATLWYLSGTRLAVHPVQGIAAGVHVIAARPQSSWLDALRTLLHPLVPWTVPVWSAGVALLGFKSVAGWRRARRLVREASHEVPESWQQAAVRIASRVGVHVRVSLIITARVAVPCVVGWLRPVILLPPAALTGLSTQQLEMVLAHELSHIRRHDYLVNLLQVIVETLLFYHPVVRWVSRDARREREHCCDDTAVHACGDALRYAHALTDLEAMRSGDVSPALGLNGGDLALRVERLIAPHPTATTPRLATLALISALCLSGLLALSSARHLPMPVASNLSPSHSFALPMPVANSFLRPTRLQALLPTADAQLRVTALQQTPGIILPAIVAPQEPQPVRQPSIRQDGPRRIGGAPLSSLLTPGDGDIGLSTNKRSGAQLDFVPMRRADDNNLPSKNRDRCEPLTGSRVCD